MHAADHVIEDVPLHRPYRAHDKGNERHDAHHVIEHVPLPVEHRARAMKGMVLIINERHGAHHVIEHVPLPVGHRTRVLKTTVYGIVDKMTHTSLEYERFLIEQDKTMCTFFT